jgi:phospholipid/cholesterol/gamma-HCH transport system substrate-binding protein
MKQENVNYYAVGLFVLAMFVLLLAVLYRITGSYTKTEPYYVEYPEITDVHVGTTVSYGGYQIGRVAAIVPLRKNGKTIYKLTLAIEAGWKIPRDSVARIVVPRLLSESNIDIIEGDSNVLLAPGDVLQGQEAVTAATLLRELNETLKPLIVNLNHRIDTIGGDLETNVPQITAGINQLVQRFNASADRIATILSDANQRHLASVFANADTITANLKDASRDFNRVDKQLEKLLNNSNKLLAENNPDVRRAVLDLRAAMETVSQHIDAIVYNLESSSRNLNEFSRRVRENPGVLLRGSSPTDETAPGK